MQNTTRSWTDLLKASMEKGLGNQNSEKLWHKYKDLFPADYRTLVSPRYGLNDILQIERLLESKTDSVDLVSPYLHHPNYRLHFYSLRERYLDEFIPVLENLGLRIIDQVQFNFTIDDATPTIKSFTVKPAQNATIELKQSKNKLLHIIQAVMERRVENDALNKLCLLTGMCWQEIDVLRAYRNYFLQLGHKTTSASIHRALVNNPEAAHGLFNYFEARFKPNPDWKDPVRREERALFPLRMQLLGIIDHVSDINDDRILRTLFNLIDATVRSNFHKRLKSEDYFIAFKVNSIGVIDMPAPKPQCEIYVHAYDMEGIHLRAGKISRGGIRWSDRLDDFRSEILGLMQTQVNKNALIIPTGAKGGFIVKNNGIGNDFKEAGKKAYIRLIRGLLDLTDNYRNNNVVNPKDIIIHDDPDPYLVVAADKGTAKFSDIANGVADETGFWLSDAFASGGSHGYDHKALGITARGAWECVKRHFLERGKDIRHESFTVIGIGSMDGDVFGNGMLQSPTIRLLAAFSGQHIFIDPSPPENETAFNERKRLFELPGSTWDDYERALISNGGGVYLRSAKDIPVSPELKKWLGIRYKSIDGESLIRQLLTAPVELLWLGGIGTYVKASTEKHEEVGDRGNENVRIDACQLSAKVVGEGANLGFTQKARIEYALKGGRINTDAVDNSAGVDTSDHEVNLKILLNILKKQELFSDYQALFTDMTDAVCELVLADNVAQSLCLSLEQKRCKEHSSDFLHIADRLEAAGYLDRTVESFPQSKDIQSRDGQIITRPEFADLIAAGKRFLTQELLNEPEQLNAAYYEDYLLAYFPNQIVEKFRRHLSQHPLANEIKATVISNKIINHAGCGFLNLFIGHSDTSCLDAVNCYLAFDRILQADKLRNGVFGLENKVETGKQYELLVLIEQTLSKFCRWSLANDKYIQPDESTVKTYQHFLDGYLSYFEENPTRHNEVQFAQDEQSIIPSELVQNLSYLVGIQNFPFIVQLTMDSEQDFTAILKQLDNVQQILKLNEVQQSLDKIPLSDQWQIKLFDDLQADIQLYSGRIVINMLSVGQLDSSDYFEQPELSRHFERYRQLFQEVQTSTAFSLLPYLYLVRALGKLTGE
ncbi:MAG: NAD-glutamate dehydrogenase [Methylococcaceae bacterium]|nr:NAD-glutamate dehydrogenase [Methylococcaceae bacterium]